MGPGGSDPGEAFGSPLCQLMNQLAALGCRSHRHSQSKGRQKGFSQRNRDFLDRQSSAFQILDGELIIF